MAFFPKISRHFSSIQFVGVVLVLLISVDRVLHGPQSDLRFRVSFVLFVKNEDPMSSFP